jgi:hypothetical protein
MLLAIGFTIAAEDIRHFQLGAIHGTVRLEERCFGGLDLQGNRVRQQIEWARRREDSGSSKAQTANRFQQELGSAFNKALC